VFERLSRDLWPGFCARLMQRAEHLRAAGDGSHKHNRLI
jgi:hypothetical protein